MWNKSQDRVVSRSWRGYRSRDGQEGQEQQKGPRGGGIGHSGGTLGLGTHRRCTVRGSTCMASSSTLRPPSQSSWSAWVWKSSP